MTLAQTLTAGLLKQGAERKKDESIHVHIWNKDWVAVEARYHRKCYYKYVRDGPTKTTEGEDRSKYDKAFETFCVYVVDLYGSKGGCSDVDLLRYQILKGGKFGGEYMPPNSDSLELLLQCSCYQCYLWRHAMMPTVNAPAISNHGWKVEDGRVSIQWMNLAPAPDSILAFVTCSCKEGCKK